MLPSGTVRARVAPGAALATVLNGRLPPYRDGLLQRCVQREPGFAPGRATPGTAEWRPSPASRTTRASTKNARIRAPLMGDAGSHGGCTVGSSMLTSVGDTSAEGGPGFDPTVPNVARIYDYMLGGKDNFAADRQLAEQIMANVPTSAVRYCAQQGIGQFLDVGSGLPTMDNVHEVARRVIPEAAVVYVDIDPVALGHARALLATSPGVAAIWGDAREPRKILAEVQTHGLLDLAQPVAVLMTGILHFLADTEDPAGIVGVFRDAIPAGSYLALSQATDDVRRDDAEYAKDVMRRGSASPLHTRSRSEFAAFFAGLELVDPGVVLTVQWQPDRPVANLEQAGIYVGVGHKP